MKLFYYIISLLILASFLSCDRLDQEEPIPAYIHIDSVYFHANTDSFGSLSHRINDVWVSVDQKFIGTFELPVTFPVLKEGPGEINIRAGIIDNGISNTRAPYPFYAPYQQTINFSPKKIDTILPEFTYPQAGMGISFIEDFESSKLVFDKSAMANIGYSRENNTTEVFEGSFSAKAELIEKGDLFEIITKDFYSFPVGKSVYLEMNYKTENLLSVGYYVVNSTSTIQRSVLNLYPSDEWNKIYINLGNEITYEQPGSVYKIYIGSQSFTEDPANIYLDNIKLLYFE